MASIKGVSLKSIKTGIGHDLAGFQANIYFNNKKIGSVVDSGYEGGLEFYFDKGEDVFVNAAEEYQKETTESILPATENLIYELMDLSELEKDYKKAIKKGYKAILFMDYRPREVGGKYKRDVPVPYPPEETYYCPNESSIQELLEEKKPPYYKTFQKAEDFIV